jgi:hypothetical protein
MKNKKQKIKYIDGNYDCDTLNRLYLDCGWRVASIHTAGSRNDIGAYVLLEKEDEIENALNDIGITAYNPDGTHRATNEVMRDIAEKWSELQ